ncbi:LuxR C-terminal-related transcriptional regulator [Ravibacter arvi]|uniref:LuxR C-terminal-related transcriptional regulator n=1 Tax=Ravibacter arvi TaxID=2051041 RepID=A0ABP8M292_9BACT
MIEIRNLVYLFLLLLSPWVRAQRLSPAATLALEKVEQLQLQNRAEEAILTLDKALAVATTPDELACLYAHQSGLYLSLDSLLKGKKLLDLSLENAERAKYTTTKAVAFRASAYLNNILNRPDAVVKDALAGLRLLEGSDEDVVTKYHLNYLLYGVYSKWEDEEKMEKYIRNCERYAVRAAKANLQANVCNGISSMYLARYKRTHQQGLPDSSYQYLMRAYELQEKSRKVSGNTFAITCINLANHFLEFSVDDIKSRKQKAFGYLALAEEQLMRKLATGEKWINVYGIRSSFARAEGDLPLAGQYLLQGLSRMTGTGGHFYKLEYQVNRELADIALAGNDFKAALAYRQRGEELLKKTFDEQQLLNAQKLEIQYETGKKDQQLKLLMVQAEFRKKQNLLYGGIALALLFALGCMFASYHFKLRYSKEREKKLEEARGQAALQLKIEKEEQARLKAEQELLELKRQQLEKEALANSLHIAYKNDMFRQIQDKMKEGDAGRIRKLLKEEMMVSADFEAVKMQIQRLHPGFFNQLTERATQKLTPLDLKYCAYIYLEMPTKQIAQALHVEAQSVRMSKYRLKQKFGLGRDEDLEVFLRGLDAD